MPINRIEDQPPQNSLTTAYNAILFSVIATTQSGSGEPPVVYCDIYFGGIFYKSLSKTQKNQKGFWQFDISDTCQEYLRVFLSPIGGSQVTKATPSFTHVFCRFRSSEIDKNNYLQPEGTAPIQGTGSKQPVSGTGLQSNFFYCINAVLQHRDEQDLNKHLNSFKYRTWTKDAFPLTHRPRITNAHLDESNYYPIVYVGESPIKCIRLNYRFKGQNTFKQVTKCYENRCPYIDPKLTITASAEGQKIEISWERLPYYVTAVKTEYRQAKPMSDWTVVFHEPNPPKPVALLIPTLDYEFRFTTIGNCSSSMTINIQPNK